MHGDVGNCLVVKRLDRHHAFLADMQNQHLGDGKFWKKPVATLRRFHDLFIDPTADFILWSRHIGVWEGEKAVYCGKACTIRWYLLIHPIFLLVGVELLPLNWTYWYRLRSNTHTFRRSIGPLASMYVWGRWNLLSGVEIGSVSRVLGWYVMSGRSGLETTRRPTFTCGIALIRLIRTNLWSHPCSSLPALYLFGLLMSSIGLL